MLAHTQTDVSTMSAATRIVGPSTRKEASVTDIPDHPVHDHIPAPGEPTVPELEEDETIAPRPEEEIADELRAKPDVEAHGTSSDAE